MSTSDIHQPAARLPKKVDCLGMLCPLPLLHLRRALISMAEGQAIQLLADDPTTLKDIPFFCQSFSHQLHRLEKKQTDTNSVYWLFEIIKSTTKANH